MKWEINIAISLVARITSLNANTPPDYPRASADRSFPGLANIVQAVVIIRAADSV